MNNPKNLPLHLFHEAHGARFGSLGGWDMPVQYSSIIDEHKAVRETAGLFDVSHMGEVRVTEKEAASYLDRLPGQFNCHICKWPSSSSPMCYENGSVVDDLIVYRIEEEEFLVCVNAANHAKDLEWMLGKAEKWGLAVCLTDESDAYALLALSFPRLLAYLKRAVFPESLNWDDSGTNAERWKEAATFASAGRVIPAKMDLSFFWSG